MRLDDLKAGLFYSNGAYGRTWGVRQLAEVATDAKTAERLARFKGIAGTCRRQQGHCTLAEFARWAKYQVVLQENDWKRVGSDASSSAESQTA